MSAIRWLHFQHWLKVLAIALSPLASSEITSACVTKSMPWPPHSLETTAVRKPSLDPLRMMSQSKVCARVGDPVALERHGPQLLLRELARLELPRALFLGQRNIHAPLNRHLQHVEAAGKAVAAEHEAAVVDVTRR